MRMKQSQSVLAAVVAVVMTGNAVAAEQPAVDYLREIKPLLKERCYACHGALKQEAGLRLDTAALIRRGGEGGLVVVAGNAAGSSLIERLEAEDIDSGRMPPEGMPVKPEEIARIRAWIAAGAPGPEDEQPEADPRDHWSFQPVVRPELPMPTAAGASTNPLDAFIGARLEVAGLTPRPLASKATRLRRLYLDLVGVPPSREELQAFLQDDSATAWTTVVDRLLLDPRYGERWARHWMDVWRYADWYGRRHVPDVWNSAPQVWRWRDWIVESLNSDKGYDRMVAEMLAADEVTPADRKAGYATGYLVRNWYALNPNDWMRANVEHTGKAFLGLTFNCAHCHDHKYDPITHDDYFRLRAFFEPIYVRQERVPGEADPGPFQDYDYGKKRLIQRLGAVRVFDKTPDAPTWFYTGGDERNRVTERGSIAPGVPAFLTKAPVEISPVALPPEAWYPGLQPEIQQTVLDEAEAAVTTAREKLKSLGPSPMENSPEATQRLAAAEAAYSAALKRVREAGQGGALAGTQSLVLDASSGRRIVQNQGHVQQLKALPDGSQFDFELQILADAHVNFQLAKDVVKSLTASLVAFEGGRIVAYRPGGFTMFDAGRYDFAAGQRRFHVTLVLETKADRGLLTVRSVSDDAVLVDSVPVAISGWNPVGDATKAVTFDARPGAVAVVDDVRLTAPAGANGAAGETLLSWQFEPPKYAEGQDIPGIEGWVGSSWSAATSRSYVSATAGNEELRKLLAEVDAARRATQQNTLPWRAADSGLQAATAAVASVKARIAADKAKYGRQPGADVETLARAASQAERTAADLAARASVLAHELALQQAEALPADTKDRQKQIDAATAALTKARATAQQKQAAAAGGQDSTEYTAFSQTFPQTSTGRRKALVGWMTDRNNPLTARVAVNHMWMRHFHAPLVTSVYDFGRNGSPPSHPQLLDWLAAELMESGWSMKHVHRLIVTSAAWQRETSVGGDLAAHEADPENRLLWRMNTGRMEAEVVRDSLLSCAGQLDLTMGGQSLENKQALTTNRRSLYYEVFPELGGASDLGVLFDAPNPLDCYRRTRSVVPQQALALTNSDLVHRLSTKIVADWQAEPKNTGEATEADELEERFVTEMFERILSRTPTDAERTICRDALTRQHAILTKESTAEADRRARESLVRALLNHNDFVTIR